MAMTCSGPLTVDTSSTEQYSCLLVSFSSSPTKATATNLFEICDSRRLNHTITHHFFSLNLVMQGRIFISIITRSHVRGWLVLACFGRYL
uniref:Uncharacterized protein n=1 Tax=Populus trichocarpa TaxID=3694 RepID=A0A2K1XYT1_POPTR